MKSIFFDHSNSNARNTRTRCKRNAPVGYLPLEPRRLLATLAEAGITQAAIDIINNVDGTFEGDVGNNNSGTPDIVYTDLVLNSPTVQNTLNGIISTQTIPTGATMITNVAGLSQITAGTDAMPNIYALVGDFTIASDINVPSNVHIYLDGSISYLGTYTTPDIFNSGNGESENREEAIFRLSGSRNVKLIGVNNAQLIGNPNLASSNPHVNGVLIRFSGSENILVEGFEMRALWQGVTADFGSSNVTVQNNYIRDSVKRAIWFLGTTNSRVVHNFLQNSGADGIDFDAFTADSLAYENVMFGNGRFAFFVEEGANNNFSVRQVSILYRTGNPNMNNAVGAERFMLGNASNGTGDRFVANNPGVVTRDNFFIDNTTFQPSSVRFRAGGGFIATGDNLQVGNSYFYGNQGFGVADFGPEAVNGRDVSVKAIYRARLPSGEITTASNSRTSFNSYDLTGLLNQWDAAYSDGNRPIRAEIAALPAPVQIFQETGGKVVIEAESFTSRTAGTGAATGKTFNLLHDDTAGGTQPDTDAASGDLGLIAEFNESNLNNNNGANVGNSLVGPRVDYEINFDTPGIYRVFLRMRAPVPNDNSLHVGLDGIAVSLGGFGVGVTGTDWAWVDDVVSGTQNIAVNVTTAGRHTLNLWMREDGVQIDKIVLDRAGVTPTGFGPDESVLVDATPPTVASSVRADGGDFGGTGSVRPDLAGPVSFTFSENVIVDVSGLQIDNLTTPTATVDLTGLELSYDPVTFTATWDLSTLMTPLTAGFYDIRLDSASVEAVDSGSLLDGDENGTGGDSYRQTYYVAIPGDANLDGQVTLSIPNVFTRVNTGDVAIARSNVGMTGATWQDGDFNGDGEVTLSIPNVFTRVNTGDVAVARANVNIDVRPSILASSAVAGRAAAVPEWSTVESSMAKPDLSQPVVAPSVEAMVVARAVPVGPAAPTTSVVLSAAAVPTTSVAVAPPMSVFETNIDSVGFALPETGSPEIALPIVGHQIASAARGSGLWFGPTAAWGSMGLTPMGGRAVVAPPTPVALTELFTISAVNSATTGVEFTLENESRMQHAIIADVPTNLLDALFSDDEEILFGVRDKFG